MPDPPDFADYGGFLNDVSEPYFLINMSPVSRGGKFGFLFSYMALTGPFSFYLNLSF